jgi:anti-sigma regulatory factor (Ser/Thr protein kinase)
LRLATEQAGLRARYSDVFVNLSRRSQGLVQRQLQLLERLERDEEDAEQLATLFQLDHLATRMRRNNENLMVLSGSELGRRNQRPATLADLLRAAVSEIEQYERVVMLPPTAVLIVGYAVGDLVRLVAELLDNATAFSAPSTQVTIASHSFEDGSVCIAVLDEGIGMSESELAAANEKLSNAHTVDVSTSRRMGLFVVGRLASRHGVEVSLHGGKNIPGVRATVTVPAELVTVTAAEAQTSGLRAAAEESTSVRALPAELPTNGHRSTNGSSNGSANGSNGSTNGLANGLAPSPLPRRTKPTNGSSTPDIARRLLGEDPAPPSPPPTPVAEPDPPAAEERLPLPRRSPGASTFVNPVDTAAGPVDLALPGESRPSGDSLFMPGESDWWSSVPEGRSAVEETTPIFDEMISAWFRSISDLPKDEAEPNPPWEFASDAGFDAARAVSESQPDSFTETGLPRRNPRQNLVPGSAEAGPAAEPPGYDPEELRKRLNNYQRGVTRGRDQRLIADEAGGPPTLDLSAAGWRFAARPADVTSNGLPRRPPRPPADDQPQPQPQPQPDRAAELRGRLGNFQQGLSRGRRSLAELADRARELGDEITAGARPAEQKKHETGE